MKENKDLKKIFGNNVKKLRELKGFSQEKLAEMIGVGIPALSNIECGKSYPLESTFVKLIETFEIEPYLLYIDESDFDINEAYSEMISKLEKLKTNKSLFKRVYDFVTQLTCNIE